jgi:hypothetical protein
VHLFRGIEGRVGETLRVGEEGQRYTANIHFVQIWQGLGLTKMSLIIEFEFKKCSVKTTPSTSINQVINQACQTFRLSPDSYALMNKKQQLQPSLSIRLSGLVSGSKLQLVFKPQSSATSTITIALQTENGRLLDTFTPGQTLWEMLLQFERKHELNLVRRTGVAPKKGVFTKEKEVYVMPVCVIMNKEVFLLRSYLVISASNLKLECDELCLFTD